MLNLALETTISSSGNAVLKWPVEMYTTGATPLRGPATTYQIQCFVGGILPNIRGGSNDSIALAILTANKSTDREANR